MASREKTGNLHKPDQPKVHHYEHVAKSMLEFTENDQLFLGYTENSQIFHVFFTVYSNHVVAMALSVISTAPYDGYAVLFSPFSSNKLAFVGGSNYGIAGSGGLIIIEHSSQEYRELRR